MWKITPGKQDCWGNITYWRVHRVDDWWDAQIYTDLEAAKRDVAFANGE